MPLTRILIANRGEIALRVIRACHEEGLEAVAVYSEVDRLSPHVLAADAAVELGAAPSVDSYLKIPRIIEVAQATGSDAVHPGYGFLAENAEFADAVRDAGLIFVGPSPEAIRAMGEKTEARRRMAAAGVQIVPGAHEPLSSAEEAVRCAEETGYPVLLKPALGGGGKGMRLARSAEEVRAGFDQARSEAQSAFGDDAVYLERFIERPRHVEIQVLADETGRTIHIGERECSVQRRHQKLIEESPSVVVDAELRSTMGEAAVLAASAIGYLGVGTVEFLLDPAGHFYFLEMNTRLQVEHPVTEMVYGVDLVREQLRIAAGAPMTLSDQPMRPRGHAIECRITSEDPFNGFLPATGRIEYLHVPAGPGVRWDAGISTGSEVTVHYDSLLGKLIVWGETRARALARMRRALDELIIVGVPTVQAFHRRVMDEESFVSGEYDTTYLDRVGRDLLRAAPHDSLLREVAVAAALAEDEVRAARVPTAERSVGGAGESQWLRSARLSGLR